MVTCRDVLGFGGVVNETGLLPRSGQKRVDPLLTRLGHHGVAPVMPAEPPAFTADECAYAHSRAMSARWDIPSLKRAMSSPAPRDTRAMLNSATSRRR